VKALELTVHPRLEDTNLSPEDIRQGRRTEQWMSIQKRLTDAELAAEHHRAKWTGLLHENKWHSVLSDEHRAMIATVERFAMLPHYDEDPS